MTEATAQEVKTKNRQLQKASAKLIQYSGFLLVVTVWISAGLFGLYILCFYAAALYEGDLDRWNYILPGIYHRGSTSATGGIGLHFAAGGIILVLGSIQLIDSIRVRYSAIHKWIRRLYVISAVFAALGGLVFIILKGTIGGTVMNIGFSIYGILMLVCGIETYRHAAARRINIHRAWALRLYALAIGSWLYRIDYGFWVTLTDGIGHTNNFQGPFDNIMSFFFYIPNLLVAEVFIRSRTHKTSPLLNFLSAILVLSMTGFLVLGTYYFTKVYWGPAIIGFFTGSKS